MKFKDKPEEKKQQKLSLTSQSNSTGSISYTAISSQKKQDKKRTKKPLQLPRKISFNITPNYSNKYYSKTYSKATVMGILTGLGVFVAGVIFMLVYALQIYGQIAEVQYLRRRNSELEQGLVKLPELKRELAVSEKKLEQLRYMLGLAKAPEPVDYTKLVFQYKPIIPTLDSMDTIQVDTTQIEEDIEGFYPQVPPTVGFQISRGFSQSHPGIDFATSEGKPVFATSDGIVSDVGTDTLYGNYLKLRHGPYYETFYGHLKSVSVKKGEQIRINQIVGFVGNTGRSSGPHLHFEVRHKGTPIDPSNLFVSKREYKGGVYND